MFSADERTDGLLRGSREERIRHIANLEQEGWTLDTLLDFHCGLLDHAHDVRQAAMESLIEIAVKKPTPLAVTPVTLLAYFMHTFTVSSGVGVHVVQCLAELRTSEADTALRITIESGAGSNEQFQRWLMILKDSKRDDVLGKISLEKLSSGRRKILNKALTR
jgi:hypothetical protein